MIKGQPADTPIPLPEPSKENLLPPDAAEVRIISQGLVSASAVPDGLTATQQLLVEALVPAMTGFPATLDAPRISAHEFAQALMWRNRAFRSRIVQNMVLLGLVLRPLPTSVHEQITLFASAMNVDEDLLATTERFATGTLGLAECDFDRNGYAATWDPADTEAVHASVPLDSAWAPDDDDPGLAERWAELEGLPVGAFGERVARFYQARGFVYPGCPGSAPPLLAQHDWVHVLADYGTTVEAELEVFAFIARANDDPHAFSLLAMVVSLFETGYLRAGAGLFESSPGHLSRSGMAIRVADALRRGATCPGSNDFLRTDWFALADLPVEEVRRLLEIPDKSALATKAGSVGPWERGGITPFQIRAGLALASETGRPYEGYGAWDG